MERHMSTKCSLALLGVAACFTEGGAEGSGSVAGVGVAGVAEPC